MGSIVVQGYASSGPDAPSHAHIDDVLDLQDSASAVLGMADADLFRQQFPAFANSVRYPNGQVDFYLTIASFMLNECRWGRMAPFGRSLIAAHFLALATQAASNPRGIPGTIVGVLNSGSVDKVSYGRDVQSVMEENAGHWGMTTFGLQYLRFARIYGAGPVQVGWMSGWVRDPAFYLPQSANVYAGNTDLNWQAANANSDQAWCGPNVFQNSPNAN